MNTFSQFLRESIEFEQILLAEAYDLYQNIEDKILRQEAMTRFVQAQRKYMMRRIHNGDVENALEAVKRFSKEFRELYDAGKIDLETGEVISEEQVA